MLTDKKTSKPQSTKDGDNGEIAQEQTNYITERTKTLPRMMAILSNREQTKCNDQTRRPDQ